MDYEDTIINSITSSGFPLPKLHNDTKNMPETKFEWVKYAAIHQLGCEMLNKLQIMINLNHCLGSHSERKTLFAIKLFGWSFENFVHRRSFSENNFEELLLSAQNHCIEEQKFFIDVNELTTFTKLILQCYLQRIDEQYFDLKSFLIDAEITLNIHETMADLFTQNSIDSQDWKNSLAAIEFVARLSRRQSESTIDKFNIETDEIIYNKLESNYVSQFYETKPDVESIESERRLNSLNNEIQKCIVQIDYENNCFRTIMDILSNETETLRYRIATRSAMYETDYEKVLNIGLNLKSKLEKMQSSRQFYKEQIIRFREELEEMRLRDIQRAKLEAEKLAKQKAEKLEAQKRKRKRMRSKGKKRTPFLSKQKF